MLRSRFKLIALLAAALMLLLAGCGGASNDDAAVVTPSATASGFGQEPSPAPAVLGHLRLGVAVGNVLADLPAAGEHAVKNGATLRDAVFCDIGNRVGKDRLVRFDVVAGDTGYEGATDIDAGGTMQADFADYDVAVNAAVACGAQPFVVLTGSVFGDPGCPKARPCAKHDQLLGAYARAFAAHYRNKVVAVAYQNEMNFGDNNPQGLVDVAAQVHDTNLVAAAIADVDPQMVVGFGSVGPAGPADGTNMLDYERTALGLGFSPHVGFLGVNMACYPSLPGVDCGNWQEAYGPDGIYAAMEAANARSGGHLKLVTTELTGGPDLGPADQAATLTSGHRLLSEAELPDLGALLWHGWTDRDDRSGIASHEAIMKAFRAV